MAAPENKLFFFPNYFIRRGIRFPVVLPPFQAESRSNASLMLLHPENLSFSRVCSFLAESFKESSPPERQGRPLAVYYSASFLPADVATSNAFPSTVNPTQALLLSVAQQFASIKRCLHANLLKSPQPYHPIYNLHCQIIMLCS